MVTAMIVWMITLQPVCAQDTASVDSLSTKILATRDPNMELIFDALLKEQQKMEFKPALSLALRSLEAAKAKRNALSEIFALRNLAIVYGDHGNKSEALRYFQEALNVARTNPDERFGLAVALYNMGQFLSGQGLFSEGLSNILEASKVFEAQQRQHYVILCHYEACVIHYKAKNYQQCIEEGYRVLNEYEKLTPEQRAPGDDFQIMSTYNTIALSNRELRQYDMALINYDKAEQIARRIHEEFWIGLINGNKGVVLKDMGKKEEALGSILADFKISKKYNVWGSAGMAAISLSDIYLSRRQFETAQAYLDSASFLFTKDQDIVLVRRGLSAYWLATSKLKSALGEYPEAYEALTRHVAIRDSLDRAQEALNMAKVKAGYDLDRKQTEIRLLTRNNEIQQERIRSQRTLFITTLIGLILLIILVINLIYNFRKQKNISRLVRLQRDEIEEKNMELEAQSMQLQENNQYIHSLNSKLEQKVAERTMELEAANKELDTFLYRSSHDIRRPITTLLGLDQVARHVIKDSQANLLFDKVVETARNMDNMLFKMQMVYGLNKPTPDLEPVNITLLLKNTLASFQDDFIRWGISHHLHAPEGISILSSPPLLEIIFRNLIENSILFRKTQEGAKPFIDLYLKRVNGQIEVTIADNGIGIEKRYQGQIFNLYFRASQASKGNGLGLYLVRKALDKLNGTVQLISDYGVGTSLTVVLPIVQ